MSDRGRLREATVERVLSFWRTWAGTPGVSDAVSLIEIGEHRLVYAPDWLQRRVAGLPVAVAPLVEALGDDLVELVGEARLAYGDESSLRFLAMDGVVRLSDNDARVGALREAADSIEWREASVDETGSARFGVTERDALLAVANVRVWADTIAHLGVFTAAEARERGLASRVGSAAAGYSLELGCIPQWRSRISNAQSARVADRLGFVALGRQIFARVRAHH
jgi:RimJ/RimL family protein N-acetyltransferase